MGMPRGRHVPGAHYFPGVAGEPGVGRGRQRDSSPRRTRAFTGCRRRRAGHCSAREELPLEQEENEMTEKTILKTLLPLLPPVTNLNLMACISHWIGAVFSLSPAMTDACARVLVLLPRPG